MTTATEPRTWSELRAAIAHADVEHRWIADELGIPRSTFSTYVRADGISLPDPAFVERVMAAIERVKAGS